MIDNDRILSTIGIIDMLRPEIMYLVSNSLTMGLRTTVAVIYPA